MIYERIDKNSIFAFAHDIEVIFAVINLLQGSDDAKICKDIYGEEQVRLWRRQYPFLLEVSRVVPGNYLLGILEFIIDVPIEGFNLVSYKEYLLGLEQVDFLWKYLNLDYSKNITKEDVKQAIVDDDKLNMVYELMEYRCESFLVFKAFIRETRRFIEEFFDLAQKMNSSLLEDVLVSNEHNVEALREDIILGVNEFGPFEYSQKVMGKTFYNRGPYEEFIFLPTYMMQGRVVRFFHITEEHKKQVMFITARKSIQNQDDIIRKLKIIGDKTRYQILAILAKEGPMKGKDIASRVSLATSTVSHHMEQLKESGLITEEQVKNSKYYGLSRNGVEGLIKYIQNDFEIK